MSFRAFLDAGYTILFEEWQRLGLDILAAMEKVKTWALGGAKPEEEGADVALQNERSLADLQKLMEGVA